MNKRVDRKLGTRRKSCVVTGTVVEDGAAVWLVRGQIGGGNIRAKVSVEEARVETEIGFLVCHVALGGDGETGNGGGPVF